MNGMHLTLVWNVSLNPTVDVLARCLVEGVYHGAHEKSAVSALSAVSGYRQQRSCNPEPAWWFHQSQPAVFGHSSPRSLRLSEVAIYNPFARGRIREVISMGSVSEVLAPMCAVSQNTDADVDAEDHFTGLRMSPM